MTDKILIAIPSKGRARKVSSLALLGGATSRETVTIFCPESESDAYFDEHSHVVNVHAVPASFKGITATRNYILDYARKWDIRRVIQADDDARHFTYFQGDAKTPGIRVPDDRKLDLFNQFFEMAEDLGTNLWGFQVSYDPKFYREFTPFSFTSPVVGNFMGIIEDGQRFDERLKLKEDYDFSLQSLHKYRRILRVNKYSWAVHHHETDGGCKTYRAFDTESQAIKILQKKWGSKIVSLHPKKAYEIRVRVPVKGI